MWSTATMNNEKQNSSRWNESSSPDYRCEMRTLLLKLKWRELWNVEVMSVGCMRKRYMDNGAEVDERLENRWRTLTKLGRANMLRDRKKVVRLPPISNAVQDVQRTRYVPQYSTVNCVLQLHVHYCTFNCGESLRP